MAKETVTAVHTAHSTLIHKGAGWKKGDKATFKKGEAVSLTPAEAAPLIKRKIVTPGAPPAAPAAQAAPAATK